MQVTWLKLANVRAIQEMKFRFQAGFNLVVGVNGVGKTTVLDALATCLSGIVNHANRLGRRRISRFSDDDIHAGAEAMDITCDFENSETGKPCCYTFRKLRAKQGSKAKFVGAALYPAYGNERRGRPLAVLFSTNRAVPSDRKPSKSAASGDVAAAYAYALSDRRLHLREFEAWMRVQRTLARERQASERMLEAFESAVGSFLPGYRNLRPGDKKVDGGFLLIDHGDTTLPISQLSDGERGVLALVLDLTQRLAEANPEMKAPVTDAEAVVLIDEIDLHLHPKWQRQIVEKLTTTFPRCQFIATTHSPQIIGEVEPERIHILAEGKVWSPAHSFGVDSSRILQEIMDTDSRTRDIEKRLTLVSNQIDKDKFESARSSLSSIQKILGENDADVVRLSTLISLLEGDE